MKHHAKLRVLRCVAGNFVLYGKHHAKLHAFKCVADNFVLYGKHQSCMYSDVWPEMLCSLRSINLVLYDKQSRRSCIQVSGQFPTATCVVMK